MELPVRRVALALLLLATLAFADTKNAHIEDSQQHIFPGGIGLPGSVQATCENIIPPPTPVTGQIMYCKAGAGWCAKDTTGTERCTGGAGGGGSMSSFEVIGNFGTVETVVDSNTVAIVGGTGITTTASFPDILTINLTTPVSRSLGGTGVAATTVTDLFNQLDPLTTKGDLLTNNTTDSVRLGVGADGTCLQADSTQATGLKWGACAGGGSMSSFTLAGTSGTPQTITDGNTVTIAAGTGITTTAGATDTVTVALSTPVARGNGGTGLTATTVVDLFNQLDPLTTRGDLLTIDATGNSVRLPHGGAGTFLATDGTDVFWAGVSAVSSVTCGTALTCAPNPIISTGTVSLTTAADDNILVSNGATWQQKSVPLTTGAGQVLQYDTTSNSFSAHTLLDADIPDTITLTNITQIATRSHASLQNLSADDHTQYLLLAGRSPVQTMAGQYRIGGGSNAGFDIDADIAGGSIGYMAEKGVTTPVTCATSGCGFFSAVTSGAVADSPSILIRANNNSATVDPVFAMQHSRGTYPAPAATVQGDILGTFLMQGYDGTTFGPGDLAFECYANPAGAPGTTFSGADRGTTCKLYTTKQGTAVLATDFQTNSNASMTFPVGIRTGDTSAPAANIVLDARGQALVTNVADTTGGTGGGPAPLSVGFSNACTTTGGCWLFEMFPSGVTIGAAAGQGAIDVQRFDQTVTVPSGAIGGNLTVHGYAPQFANGGTATFGIISGMHFRPNVNAANASVFTINSGIWAVLFGPTLSRTGTGTGTIPELTAIYHQPGFGAGLGAGWTVTDSRAVHCLNASLGTSTITNQGCIDIDALSGATTNYSIRSVGTQTLRHQGAARIGGTGAPTATFALDIAGTSRFEDTLTLKAVVANNPGTFQGLTYTSSFTMDSGSSAEQILNLSPTITMGAALVAAETAIRAAGTYNVTAKPTFANTFTLIQANPAVNFNVLDGGLLWNHTTFADTSVITANNVNATSGGGGITVANTLRSFVAGPTLQANGASGSYHVADYSSFLSSPLAKTDNAAGTITIDNYIHYNITALAKSGAGTETITTETGFNIPALTGTTKVAIRNQGASNQIRSAGPATFGADAATTNTSIALEVQSTTQAFMNARMTKAQFDALTLANGMQAYCTDCALGTSACTTTAGTGTMIWRVNGADRCL